MGNYRLPFFQVSAQTKQTSLLSHVIKAHVYHCAMGTQMLGG